MNRIILLVIGCLIAAGNVSAQTISSGRAANGCGTPAVVVSAGAPMPVLIDLNTGDVCTEGSAAGGNTPVIPGQTTTLDPDIASVTTGGVAVNAFSAGHCKYGCYVTNPDNATQLLCGRDTGTASGTHSNAGTVCTGASGQLTFSPTNNAISVVTSDSAHPFAGKGSM